MTPGYNTDPEKRESSNHFHYLCYCNSTAGLTVDIVEASRPPAFGRADNTMCSTCLIYYDVAKLASSTEFSPTAFSIDSPLKTALPFS